MAEPPDKKVKLGGTGRGCKDLVLASQFTVVSPGRVRCNLCYSKWQTQLVAIALSDGMSEAEAKETITGKVPSIECGGSPNVLLQLRAA